MTTIDPNLPHLVDVEPLVPYAQNARTHSREQIDQIKESIRQFGFVGVLGYDQDGLAIGHGRRMAALEMWADGEQIMGPGKRAPLPAGQLPAVDISGLSEAERRALIIADNKLALNAGWDEDILAAEMAALAALDFDMPVLGFDPDELARMLDTTGGTDGQGGGAAPALGKMAAEFMIPPFSVLNAREGWWQERKRAWIGLGIQSEVGRGENLLKMSDTMLEPDPEKRAAMIAAREAAKRDEDGESVYLKGAATVEITTDPYRKRGKRAAMAAAADPAIEGPAIKVSNGKRRGAAFGQDFLEGEGKNVGLSHLRQSTGAKENPGASGRVDTNATKTQAWVQQKIAEGDIESGLAAGQTGTSIFDPVLCELAYRWFSPKAGLVLDPFAGGSVRGIVAAALGRRYVGIDLRPEQIMANQAQWPRVAGQLANVEALDGEDAVERQAPDWLIGDSAELLPSLDIEADMIFSCPPYGDLEVYSDDPADISTLDQAGFDKVYAEIIAAAVAKLKQDRFACFVVGDYRDKRGIYANFVSKTIAAFEAAGAEYYNEAILVTAVGSLPIRAAKQFRSTRKLGKTHQNVLVFVKGDPRKAVAALGPVDVTSALKDIEPDQNDDGISDQAQAPAQLGPDQVKISAAMARLMFTQCGPDCIAANGCKGNCCDSSQHQSGCFVTVQDDEIERIEAAGATIRDNLIIPPAGTKGCPFKIEGLCSLHASGTKPWGCVASPFTLNPTGTLIVRNRYRLLPCFKGDGPKSPAYIAYRSSLALIFGEDECARIVAHLDAGGGDLIARIDPENKRRLMKNDEIRRAPKAAKSAKLDD